MSGCCALRLWAGVQAIQGIAKVSFLISQNLPSCRLVACTGEVLCLFVLCGCAVMKPLLPGRLPGRSVTAGSAACSLPARKPAEEGEERDDPDDDEKDDKNDTCCAHGCVACSAAVAAAFVLLATARCQSLVPSAFFLCLWKSSQTEHRTPVCHRLFYGVFLPPRFFVLPGSFPFFLC